MELCVANNLVSDEATLAVAAFDHFSKSLGSSDTRAFFLNYEAFDQSSLEHPFIEDEIWNAIKLLLTGKAPGHDGFTSEFLYSAWEVVKGDICHTFDKLFALNGRSCE